MKTRVLPLLVLAGLAVPCAALHAAATDVKLTRADDRVRVEIGGKLFTEYVFKGAPKPYLYPVLAADGTELMRHFPMKKEDVLAGKKGPKRDVVLLNTAFALVAAGVVDEVQAGIAAAAEAIDSGRAQEKLDGLVRLTNE
jgi:hypothetical protein